MIKLSFPFTEEKIRALKVGDEVFDFRRRVHRAQNAGLKRIGFMAE
jgi:hypothetical protein